MDEDYEGHRPHVVPARRPIVARDTVDTAPLEEARLPDFTPRDACQLFAGPLEGE